MSRKKMIGLQLLCLMSILLITQNIIAAPQLIVLDFEVSQGEDGPSVSFVNMPAGVITEVVLVSGKQKDSFNNDRPVDLTEITSLTVDGNIFGTLGYENLKPGDIVCVRLYDFTAKTLTLNGEGKLLLYVVPRFYANLQVNVNATNNRRLDVIVDGLRIRNISNVGDVRLVNVIPENIQSQPPLISSTEGGVPGTEIRSARDARPKGGAVVTKQRKGQTADKVKVKVESGRVVEAVKGKVGEIEPK